MKTFISWSGELSRGVAETLRDWLPSVIQTIEPYVSSEDIYKGVRWSVDVSRELEASNYGILCVTASNINAGWLNFEAGALSKSFDDKNRVSPFLIDVDASNITGPLLQFQSTVYERGDVLKLLRSINSVSDMPLESARLKTAFDRWWPELQSEIDDLLKRSHEHKPVETPGRTVKEMVAELLDLARAQQKALSSSTPHHAPVRHDAGARLVGGVNVDEVSYLLGRLRVTANSAVKPGQPETPARVQLGALVELLAASLAPIAIARTFESTVPQSEEANSGKLVKVNSTGGFTDEPPF